MCLWVGPHAPSFGRQLWGAAQPCGVSLTMVLLPRVYGTTTSPLWLELRGFAAWQVNPSWAVCWLAGAMAPGDVCHGARCSLAGLGPLALGSRPCCWPGGTAGSPQCVQPVGCGLLPSVPWLPWACLRVRCPWPLGARSPVCGPGVVCAWCVVCRVCAVSMASWRLFTGARAVCALCVVLVVPLGLSPCLFLSFFFLSFLPLVVGFLFFFNEEKGKNARTEEAQARPPRSSGVFVCTGLVVCVACALAAAAPQGCGWRVIVYTGVGQCGSVCVFFFGVQVRPRVLFVGVACGLGGLSGLGGSDGVGRGSRLLICRGELG